MGTRLGEISEFNFIELLDEYGFGDLRVRMAMLSFPVMRGLHLEDPLVFCGLETEDELLAHLARVDAGDAQTCEWLHMTNLTRFDATMAPPGHQMVRAEAVVPYAADWPTRGAAFADSCLALLQRYADVDEIVLRRHTTPVDIEAKLTTMKRGSIKHGAYTPLQMGFLRPNDLCSRSETPIPGLFIGGASMYPGGMILGGPGFIAAGVVQEFLGGGDTGE